MVERVSEQGYTSPPTLSPPPQVHMRCYGIESHPAGSAWLCGVCRLDLPTPPPCVLCPRSGGAMKPTSDGRWCHLLCATWVPETFVEDEVRCAGLFGGEGGKGGLGGGSYSLA